MTDTWTLCLDESGSFEGAAVPGERPERHALILGGVLSPGAAADLAARWRPDLRRTCRDQSLDYPPHAVALAGPRREALYAVVRQQLAAAGGRWLFIVDRPQLRDGIADLAIFVRMLADVIDLAARVASRAGARRLEVRPASRRIPVVPALVGPVRKLGLALEDKSDGTPHVRTLAEIETRQALDALTREPAGALPAWPDLASIEVVSAKSPESHPGIAFADLGCHWIYTTLRDAPDTSLDTLFTPLRTPDAPAPLLAARFALRSLRALDRALREIPADLVRASRTLAVLEGDTAADRDKLSPYRAVREGSVHLGRELWSTAVSRLAATAPPARARIARALASHADAHLAAKTGDYEGTWRALHEGWAGDTPLARNTREAVSDRELAAQLWRVTMECANHRGDVAAAQNAAASTERMFRRGLSLALLAERLRVRNLAHVVLQNQLPASPEHAPALREALLTDASTLEAAADEAGAVLEVAMPAGYCELPPPPDSPDEASLWRALDHDAPRWQSPDLERGRCYGSVARTHAFLGDVDRALDLALRARSFFADSSIDLAFNASVIARIELERVRRTRRPASAALAAALTLAGVRSLSTPKAALGALVTNPAARFGIDLILRALAWNAGLDGLRPDDWRNALRKSGESSLFGMLSTGEFRSHPTELIARHAAELLRAGGDEPAAQRWFELALALSREAAPGSTIARFAPFVAALASDPSFTGQGPEGCWLNPTFEYR